MSLEFNEPQRKRTLLHFQIKFCFIKRIKPFIRRKTREFLNILRLTFRVAHTPTATLLVPHFCTFLRFVMMFHIIQLFLQTKRKKFLRLSFGEAAHTSGVCLLRSLSQRKVSLYLIVSKFVLYLYLYL